MPKKPCAAPGCSRLIDVGSVFCDRHEKEMSRDRGQSADARRADRPSRKWYKRKAWSGKGGRRERQLDSEPLCRMCPEGSKRIATIADHVIPHRDDYALFWYGELQSLCKPCHDIKKQRAERREAKGGAEVAGRGPGDPHP